MTISLASFQKEWKSLLADNKWGELFEGMTRQLSGLPAQTALQLKGRHSRMFNAEMNGIVSGAEANLEYNQIRYGLFSLIDNLTAADLGGGGAPAQDPLDALVRTLHIDIPLSTPLYLVNCDRRREWRAFRRGYATRGEACCLFQYYFVLACPTQEPEGFAERVVYELLGEHAGTHRFSVLYRRHDGSGRLRIEALPLGPTPRAARDAFKTYFADRFDLGNADFEQYLRTDLPRLQADLVATALHITAGDWDPDILDGYLQWLMDTFQETDNQTPTFLFFFIISLKNAHQPDHIRGDDREVLQSVETLVQNNPHRASLITPLPPVPTDDLEEWLEKLGHITQSEKNAILTAMTAHFTPEQHDQFAQHQLLDMEPIEDLQERVYRAHR